ncbi:hypothetical protein [Bacillus cereus group sp. N21]|uniref:hypothetical protein n=1 Tax=Bacillus cereus group sp. N21 TaxID=2794591 RepID=UPI0018F6B3B7|nr:hypothetical protein [Bacillus cereus group sp. N21]MBJ8030410.1 hypothetical protein [Bacillus cereus group sp. N21]
MPPKMNEQILGAIEHCLRDQEKVLDFWIREYEFNLEQNMDVNQFIIMLKPELTMIEEGVNVKALLNRILSMLKEHKIKVKSARILSSSYLLQNNLMEKHYGMLNQVSKFGLEKMSIEARNRLFKKFPYAIKDTKKVLGGHQFLSKHPNFSSYFLEVLTRNVKVNKLGAGIYAIEAVIDGEKYVILNPFHPCQVEWFTSPGKSVVLFECSSSREMKSIRRETIGATDPQDAVQGSIKHMLLKEQERFGLSNICTRFNGIHISPGPIEGMAGLIHYFSDSKRTISFSETAFGNLLLRNGYSEKQIHSILENPEIQVGDRIGAIFELTEDCNSNESLELLKAYMGPF